MRWVHTLFCLGLFLFRPAGAESVFYSEPLTLPDGSFFCCTKRYASCEESCRAACLGMSSCQSDLECPAHCRGEQCQAGKDACHGDAPEKRSASMALHYDGQVSGPGAVHFEIHRRGATLPRLTVYGIVYGKRHDNAQIEVLTKSETHAVAPGQTVRFDSDDFAEWSKRCDTLTVAIAMPSETDRARWTYHNELTPQDAEKAATGEMRVKGEFVWKGE